MRTSPIVNGGRKRFVGLDILRISLALLVYMFHSQWHFKCNYYFLNNFVEVGAIAMTGFMMLSGFVLFMSYSQRDFIKLSEVKIFYLKRIISIIPLYYSIASLHVLYQMIGGEISLLDVAILFPVEFFSVQSTYFSLFYYSHNGGTWFISCILICYAVYPYLQFIISKISNRFLIITFILNSGMLLYAPLVRIYFNLDMVTIYANPFYRMLEFIIGIILARIVSTGYRLKLILMLNNSISLVITILFMISSISLFRHFYHINDYMFFNWIALPCFILVILNLAIMSFKSIEHSKLVAYLSSISFTLFLCQVLPLWDASWFFCNLLGSNDNVLKILISFTICLLGAILIHEGIEKPASKYLKKKLLK